MFVAVESVVAHGDLTVFDSPGWGGDENAAAWMGI